MKRKQRRWQFCDCYQVGQYHWSAHRKPKAPLHSNSIHVWHLIPSGQGLYQRRIFVTLWVMGWSDEVLWCQLLCLRVTVVVGKRKYCVCVSWYSIKRFDQWQIYLQECGGATSVVWRCRNCCNVSLLFGAVTSMTDVAACWLFIVHCTLWQPRNNISIPGNEKFFLLPKTS